LHFEQIGLTDDFTFMIPLFSTAERIGKDTLPPRSASFKSVCDPSPGQVIGRQLHRDLVTWKDANEMHAHFPRNVSQYSMSIVQLDPKHGVRQGFLNRALDFDHVFLCHDKVFRFLFYPSALNQHGL